MRVKLLKVASSIILLILMKLGASALTSSSQHFQTVMNKDLDPSQMFYTESRETLAAEKEVYKRITNGDRVN